MSAAFPLQFRLSGRGRAAALDAVANAPDGWMVRISPPKRTNEQNRIFHAIVDDFAKHMPEYHGVPMDAESWKSVLIVSFAKEEAGGAVRLVPDLDGAGLVQVRESSATMGKARATALIDYCMAEAARLGVPLRDYDGGER